MSAARLTPAEAIAQIVAIADACPHDQHLSGRAAEMMADIARSVMGGAGYIVTLETRNFSFEAHGRTEEEANEAMGRTLTRHAAQYTLPADWWADYEFATRLFRPGTAFRDGEALS